MDSEILAKKIAHITSEMKATDIRVLDLRGLTSFTDFFLVCSGTSDRHTKAIAEQVKHNLKDAGILPNGVEGEDAGQWVLLDYGGVVAHIFQTESREFYQIEKLWSDAPCQEFAEAS